MDLGNDRRIRAFTAWLLLCALVALAGATSFAGGSAAAQESSASQEAVAPAAEPLGPDELRKLVAPVALYPDDLLAIVLPASTNPLQIVQAQRFLDNRKTDQKLQPDPEWDPSIFALINYPEVVSKMNADLDWTEDLGNAVIDQQSDVMDMIQQIRAETYASGYLQSNETQVVIQEKETIIIEPSDPDYIYIPDYPPEAVYIEQPIAYPPPVYVSHYPYYWSPAATFFAGAIIGGAFGYGFDWDGDDIDINVGDNCCGGDINIGNDINIGSGNRVEHHTGDRFNADRQRVNGSDKLKWSGNKARQKQATGKKRAAAKSAGTLPAKGTGARAKQTGAAGNAAQKKRAGDAKAKGGRSSGLGTYEPGRKADAAGNKGKQSLQSSKPRQKSQRSGQNRSRQSSGAFGGYGGSSSTMMRQSSRGNSSFKSSGRSGGRSRGGGRR
jgi:hypothetical protein